MAKINVGDKVRVIAEDHKILKKGHIFKVREVDRSGDVYDENGICVLKTRVELKPTKSQRITILENEVAELKLIVHELRERSQLTTVINNSIQGPSATNNIEGVKPPEVKIKNSPAFMTAKEGAELGELISKGIVDGLNGVLEYEGQQYRKVERKAREGDVVIFTQEQAELTSRVSGDKPYKVITAWDEPRFITDASGKYRVYENRYNRTLENVTVYELIKQKPLTPNQQRAAIIEKAKKFVEETEKYLKQIKADRTKGNYIYQEMANDRKFVINEEKRAITALLYNKFDKIKLNGKGIAKCKPSDVFNEHIGKAIALGRALGLDVSEFEQAVQPNEVVMGHIIAWNESPNKAYKVVTKNGDRFDLIYLKDNKRYNDHEYCEIERFTTILSDTNAIY